MVFEEGTQAGAETEGQAKAKASKPAKGEQCVRVSNAVLGEILAAAKIDGSRESSKARVYGVLDLF